MGLELRADRLHHCLSRAACLTHRGELNNICFIGGDASAILPHVFLSSSVDQFFVNHPEPPERRSSTAIIKSGKQDDGETNSDSSHLFTGPFLEEMVRVLRPEGTITIVTDNRVYAKLLASTVNHINDKVSNPKLKSSTHMAAASVLESPDVGNWGTDGEEYSSNAADIGSSASMFTSNKRKFEQTHSRMRSNNHTSDIDSDSDASSDVLEESDVDVDMNDMETGSLKLSTSVVATHESCRVWSGEPGEMGGHVASDATSYFSRMWQNGDRSRKWFLYLRKKVI